MQAALAVVRQGQRENAGWICAHVGRRVAYCTWSRTPQVFVWFAHAGLINNGPALTRRAAALFAKDKIIGHGHHRDHYYRRDETLPAPRRADRGRSMGGTLRICGCVSFS